jgi:predicted nucleic acid-binding protein
LRRLREPLRCCGAVLGRSVVCSSPFSPALRRIRAEIERGNIIPEPESVTVWRRCFALIEQYANVPMSFADAYLIAMAEALPGSQIFTLDRDFEIYRMENGQSPALIAPFGTD